MNEEFSLTELFFNEFVVGIIFGGIFAVLSSYFSVRFQSRRNDKQLDRNVLSLCELHIEDFVVIFKKFDENASRLNHFDAHSIKIMDNILYRFESYHREFVIHMKDIKLRNDIIVFFREVNVTLADLKEKLEKRGNNSDDFHKRMVYGPEVLDPNVIMDAARQNYDLVHQAEIRLRSVISTADGILERIKSLVNQ